jgi:hypothetical protein
MNHSVSSGLGSGFCPYQTVVLWYPLAGTITAVIIVAILKVGQSDIN